LAAYTGTIPIWSTPTYCILMAAGIALYLSGYWYPSRIFLKKHHEKEKSFFARYREPAIVCAVSLIVGSAATHFLPKLWERFYPGTPATALSDDNTGQTDKK
jgi:hypothetical protein